MNCDGDCYKHFAGAQGKPEIVDVCSEDGETESATFSR